jgi:hypothetical protein
MKPTSSATFFLIRLWPLLLVSLAFHSDSPLSQYTVPAAAVSVFSADLDLDGKVDIVTGHHRAGLSTWSGIAITKNTGNGNFLLEDSLYFNGGFDQVLCGQLDSNAHPEIIIKKWNTTMYIGIIYNDNYADTLFLNTNSQNNADYIALGDIDNNGLNDIVFCSAQGGWFGIFYNYGYRNFSNVWARNVGNAYPIRVSCGDLNGDGKDDIVIGGHFTQVYYSLPGFPLEALQNSSYQDLNAVVDFDGDGHKDVIAAATWAGSMTMYRNMNDTSLQLVSSMPTIDSYDFLVNDINGDGLPDIAFLTHFPDTSGTGLIDTVGGIKIFYNQGNFQLSSPQFIRIINHDESGRSFHSSDMDGNGYNDFVFTRATGLFVPNNLEILFNHGNGIFNGTPVGLNKRMDKSGSASLRCFPNPSSGSTTILYEVERRGPVVISISDQTGREVMRFNEGIRNKGINQLPVTNTVLHPGVYYYRLILDGVAGNASKMLIQK